MIIDPDVREVDEPVVTVSMSMKQAEWLTSGLSDFLCWSRGFNAALAADDYDKAPMGVHEIREFNIALKKSMENAR